MTKQKQDKQIIENAPELTSHIDDDVYVKAGKDGFDEWDLGIWCGWYLPTKDIRKLDDIRELVALRDEVAEKDKRIAELEVESSDFCVQYHNALEQINDQNKRIAELEKYNLDLANEGHAKSERIMELDSHARFVESKLSVTEAKLAGANAEIESYMREVSFMENGEKLTYARIDKLERAVQHAINTCCLDEKDESVLVDVLDKGGDA